MKHLFVNYETALALKEKGFDEKCIIYYNEGMLQLDASNTMFGWRVKDFEESYMKDRERIPAPLYQQVIDWFREKHDLHIFLIGSMNRNKNEFCCEIITVKKQTYLFTDKAYSSLSYYKALNKAIEEALKLV